MCVLGIARHTPLIKANMPAILYTYQTICWICSEINFPLFVIVTKKFGCIDLERFAKFFDQSTPVQTESPGAVLSVFKCL